MVEVSKEEFFAMLGPLNVHPRCASPDYTDWELQDGTRKMIGRSTPGWASPYGTQATYWVLDQLLPDTYVEIDR